MDDQVTTAIAMMLATKVIDGLADGGRAAFAALAGLVRRKLARGGGEGDAVQAVQDDPAEGRVHELGAALAAAMAGDPAFDQEVRRLWQQVEAHRVEVQRVDGANAVVNTVSGRVHGNVVQARDVQGGISFN